MYRYAPTICLGSIKPILLVLYINDFLLCVEHSKLFMFADNTTVILNSKDYEDLKNDAFSVLSSIVQWFSCNKITINFFFLN